MKSLVKMESMRNYKQEFLRQKVGFKIMKIGSGMQMM